MSVSASLTHSSAAFSGHRSAGLTVANLSKQRDVMRASKSSSSGRSEKIILPQTYAADDAASMASYSTTSSLLKQKIKNPFSSSSEKKSQHKEPKPRREKPKMVTPVFPVYNSRI